MFIPETFAAYRDADILMARTVLKMQYADGPSTGDHKLLADDPHLQITRAKTAGRITLLSATKANVTSHYGTLRVEIATEERVCVPSGLKYRYFDSTAQKFVATLEDTDTVARSLMYRLPKRAEALQKYLFRPHQSPDGVPTNNVIASPPQCPSHMTLEEYIRLCSMPMGHCIEWPNMLLETEVPSIDFKKEETALFFMQCSHQAGPPGRGTHRSAHQFLEGVKNGRALISSLNTAFARVKENWQSAQAVSIFAAVACRLLSLTGHADIENQCLQFLQALRTTTFCWAKMLRDKAQHANTDTDRAEFRAKSVELALICTLCADVDERFLSDILAQPESGSVFIQCCIIVQEGKRPYSAVNEPYLALLKHRFDKLLFRSFSLLRLSRSGIENAIKGSWSAYKPGDGWKPSAGGGGHWIHTRTVIDGHDGPLAVHLDLLSGELLVNGRTLGRPRDEVEKQSLWQTLFRDTAIEVMPTTVPGMEASIKQLHQGFDVHFGLQDFGSSTELIVKASSHGTVYQLLPPRLFSGRLPEAFVQRHVHWYNVTDNVVEFRSINHPWDDPSWTLRRVSQSAWRLGNNGKFLVGMASLTANKMAEILQPLVDPQHIHCILQQSGHLEVEVPSIRLNFFLERGQPHLRSRDFRGMSVDQMQSLDTLVGLENKLLLRRGTSTERAVLIPEGNVNYELGPGHTRVHIAKSSITKVHYLSVDCRLGRLVDDTGSLQTKLHLVLLHALTASSLPDPLLGKTGTEQALAMLKQASVRSFAQLSEDNTAILRRIASLSPGRSYYPTHFREVQQIAWDDCLSFFSQHNDFVTCVRAIFDQAERSRVLYQGSVCNLPDLKAVERHLRERDAIRSSIFRVSGFGAESHSRKHDVSHEARDRNQSSLMGSQARILSGLVGNGKGARQYAARNGSSMALLQTFAQFRTVAALRELVLPTFESCSPPDGYEITKHKLEVTIKPFLLAIEATPEAEMKSEAGETWQKFEARQAQLFRNNRNAVNKWLVDALLAQTQLLVPDKPGLEHAPVNASKYIRLDDAIGAVRKKFEVWYNNRQLFRYFEQVAAKASSAAVRKIVLPEWPTSELHITRRDDGFMSVKALFSGAAPILEESTANLPQLFSDGTSVISTTRLAPLLGRLQELCQSSYERRYANELSTSLECLANYSGSKMSIGDEFNVDAAKDHLATCHDDATKMYSCIVAELKPSSSVLCNSEQWPRVSTSFLLQQLTSGAWEQLSPDWQMTLVKFGQAMVQVQRAERILRAVRAGNCEDMIGELKNVPHSNWDPLRRPDWRLLEIEAGITIREVQVQIANEMMAPSGGHNSVMQLNMGEGKSSVIVPMVTSALADTTQLVRVVVAKPQSKQMQNTLITRLGGLLGRRVYYLPFSRSTKLDKAAANAIEAMLQECMAEQGVLLIQPEHILSFKLMYLELTNLGKDKIADSLLRIQDDFDTTARDIVDESDEIFSPKFELIYTMGQQGPIECSPGRWECIQQVLGIVRSLAFDMSKQPHFLEYNNGIKGGFPRIRILKQEANDLLISGIVDHICKKGLHGFTIASQNEAIRTAVKAYISKAHPEPDEIALVEGDGAQGVFGESTKPVLLLLRGLLAGGVLGFAFRQKRWRVNFGLAPTRTPRTQVAVPYTSKDQPSPRSEFSHPDVVIILTCLCYYNDGLTNEDLFITIRHMMDSDQANAEYSLWLKETPGMPAELCHLEGINLQDRQQCEDVLFPNLCHGKYVVDYFLAHIVFPKEMKEFPSKLSSSGWDIGQANGKLTTGFSGTNDSRKLLPLDVMQLDLPAQRHTNALVLEYLLQPENTVVMMPKRLDTSVSDADHLLSTVVKQMPPVRVILDAGAQVLELNNRQVAARWLELDDNDQIKAAVFVDDNDEVSVLDRNGRDEVLRTSPFASQLDGHSLKLPHDYRAAVTLGPALSKDKLVQACMRMRRLGKGQSVVFCVNEEMENNIRLYTSRAGGEVLDVDDIILWAVSETFTTTKRAMPLWAVQGIRFLRQRALWEGAQWGGTTAMSKASSQAFIESEAQTLDQRYRPRTTTSDMFQSMPTTNPRLAEIQQRCCEFDDLQFNASTLQEEQERELAIELEQERQVQRPTSATPATARLRPDVQRFMLTSELSSTSGDHIPAFDALLSTSAGAHMRGCHLVYDSDAFRVSADFAATIVQTAGTATNLDAYQSPVQWILTRRSTRTNKVNVIMIISAMEAQRFMELPKLPARVTLHLYKPRCNSSFKALDDLAFWTHPKLETALTIDHGLTDALNLFAGQLYFASFDEYQRVCRWLNLATRPPLGVEEYCADGFVRKDANGQVAKKKSPVKFLQTLMSKIRKNGLGISKTHMGMVLEGSYLQPTDFAEWES